jgi:hypothetical protein
VRTGSAEAREGVGDAVRLGIQCLAHLRHATCRPCDGAADHNARVGDNRLHHSSTAAMTVALPSAPRPRVPARRLPRPG